MGELWRKKIIVELFRKDGNAICDLEIPLHITAIEFLQALNQSLHLGIRTDISVDEIEEKLREYDLTKNYDEYQSMSEQEKANYDALAWLATMAMLPDDIPVPGTYTLPVGDGIPITYSVSAKGTITDGEISTTIEMQKNELNSLTYSKDNADLIINDEEVSVNVK